MASKVSPVAAPAQTFAFITHSPATLPNNLPPDVDDASLARRRRRRTSHKDQIILEEEFAKCDRPDKHKRKEIAARVGLEDKQVQIWFQNRRQTHRRKSKPLQPHEIIPRNVPLSSDPIISPFNSALKIPQDDDTIELPSHSSRPSSPCPDGDLQSHHTSDATEPDISMMTADTSVSSIESFMEPEISRKTSPIHFLLNPASETPDTSFESTQSTIPDDLEMSHFNMTKPMDIEEPVKTFVNPRRSGFGSQPAPSLLKRSSSAVRLSMSFDGKATIILEDDEDALPRGSQTSQTSFHEHTPPKRRTENAKIWESCCDTSLGVEPVKEDSPRKALKTIRARGVVAAAKAKAAAAADARKQKPTTTALMTSEAAKKKKTKNALGPKSANPIIPLVNTTTSIDSPKPLKIQHFSPATSKTNNNPRKVLTASQKGPKKATPSPQMSAINKNRSPYRTLADTLNGKNANKAGFTIYQSSDEGDSDKENWEPGFKVRKSKQAQQPIWRPKGPRDILGDLDGRVPQPNELEVIENLMSLRDGLWR
ncbi:hypothetical protein TWF225_010429 [Orbilia oligospora]|uniref:Homeobox domain-containing protein n=1 Tax=Orbilia oligospora TaxID=2813651 RepID=A0A8H2HLW9_ORBOL|nr:hypothetical protein TWF225_010429 [Orbilia oligospora]KAF3241290.1 hypothetical protein TWF217_000577 [Orbilia oligospora]KAF3255536.1 hypothetical protein TWF128_005539 [Orbilia oligospora]KAF3255537.1 hypothetical protein TWF128_005539 [Orbilia oligospora]KAF3255538.1 hypothetical protein TWF128_005539 [Orbilia oligospora]